jgi:hypothetical protein
MLQKRPHTRTVDSFAEKEGYDIIRIHTTSASPLSRWLTFNFFCGRRDAYTVLVPMSLTT